MKRVIANCVNLSTRIRRRFDTDGPYMVEEFPSSIRHGELFKYLHYDRVSRGIINRLLKKNKIIYLKVYGLDKWDILNFILSLDIFPAKDKVEVSIRLWEDLIKNNDHDIVGRNTDIIIKKGACYTSCCLRYCECLPNKHYHGGSCKIYIMELHKNTSYLFPSNKSIVPKFKSVTLQED